MSENRKTLHLFSHLPKTGGTTIRKELQSHYKLGESFFHFAINGFKEMSRIGMSPFDTLANLKETEDQDLILFGHKVNESLLKDKTNYNIELTTMLRHPFSRLISQYYMRKNSTNKIKLKPLNIYINNAKDPMCSFFVKRFPSLISNPYQNLSTQALEVLSHFNNIEILEEAPQSFQKILKVYNLKYDPIYNSNIGSNKPHKPKVNINDLNSIFHSSIKQDLDFYNKIRNNKNRCVKEIELSNILLPNNWLIYFIKKLFTNKSYIIPYYNSISSYTIKKIIKPQLSFNNLNYNVLLKSLITIEHQNNLTQELKYNFFALFNYILLKLEKLPLLSNDLKSTFYGKIITELQKSNLMSIRNINSKLIFQFPEKDLDTLYAQANYYITNKKFISAIDILEKLIRIYPLEHLAFNKIYNLSKITDNKKLESLSLHKYYELYRKLS